MFKKSTTTLSSKILSINSIKCSTLLLIPSVFLVACASSYKGTQLDRHKQGIEIEQNQVKVSVDFGLPELHRTEDYREHMADEGILVAAVTIANNSSNTLVLNENLMFTDGDKKIGALKGQYAYSELRQPTEGFFWYMLLTPVYFIGPVLTVINVIPSYNANTLLEKELMTSNLVGKSIAPNSTLSGFVAFRKTSFVSMGLDIDATDTTNMAHLPASTMDDDTPIIEAPTLESIPSTPSPSATSQSESTAILASPTIEQSPQPSTPIPIPIEITPVFETPSLKPIPTVSTVHEINPVVTPTIEITPLEATAELETNESAPSIKYLRPLEEIGSIEPAP